MGWDWIAPTSSDPGIEDTMVLSSTHPTPRLERSARRPADERRRPFLALIADDTLAVRETYGAYIRFVGDDALAATNGLEAVRLAFIWRPDVIVLDLAMPRMTGWAAIRVLRSDPRTCRTPIVALSSQDTPEGQAEALEAGADVCLTKPCRKDDLLQAIVCLLRRPSPRDRDTA
jgi:two-component system OmpR family response regulator